VLCVNPLLPPNG